MERALIAHGTQHLDQLERIQVQHILRIRVIADLWVVAGHGEEVGDAAGRAAQHVGLERDAVAVLACHLHHRLDAKLAQNNPRAERRHTPKPALVVGQIDGVHRAAQAAREALKLSLIHI